MKKIKIDRSNLVIICTYAVVFIATIILSLFNVGLDLTKLTTSEYIGNLCLNYALSIIIVVAAMKDSEIREMKKDQYLSSTNGLLEVLNIIKVRSLDTVFKLYTKFRFKKMREEYIEDKLFKAGLPKDIYNLTIYQIKKLKKEKKINNEQFSILKKLKNGKFKFREISSEEILNDYEKQISYQDMRSNKNKIIVSRIVPKFIMLFATSAVFAAAIIDEYSSGTAVILITLFTRLITIITALFAGYIAGGEITEDKCNVKKLKRQFCHEFLTDFDSCAYVPNPCEMESDVLAKIKEMSAIHAPDANYSTSDAEDEEIELTEEELKIIKDNRKNNSTPA